MPDEDATPENFDVVRVDMKAEILKMAAKDGINHVAMLEQPVTMKRAEYYRASIVAHYRGVDAGFREAMLGMSARIRRNIVTAAIAGGTLGVLVGGGIMLAFVRH